MSGLETAIRTALDNADRGNAEVRARIYQSARQALEAGLRKQDITDVEAIAFHRHRLETTIHSIEAEERARTQQRQTPRPASAPPPADVPVPAVGARNTSANAAPAMDSPVSAVGVDMAHDDGPMVSGETRAPQATADMDAASGPDDLHIGGGDHLGAAPVGEERPVAKGKRRGSGMDFRPERAAGRRKPRKFFSRLLLWCVFLAFVGIGAWWAYSSSLLMTAAERDTSVANPPASTQPEDYDGNDQNASNEEPMTIDPQNGFSADWVEVFKPSDADKLVAGAQAKTQNVAENDGPAVRLISQSGSDDGNIAVSIPAAVLQQLSGKASTIAITLQSTSDEPTQVTVECNFGSLGNCARHRFSVTRERSDALLQVRFDRSMAPTSPGSLLINSDVDGKARGINLYAVRVLPGQ